MRPWDYDEHLAEIERRNPAEPLLPTLRKGFSAINAMYIKIALGRMPTHVEEELDLDVDQYDDVAPDEVLIELWGQRTRLFGLLNKQANKFHECTTDAQRKENSELVLGYWDDIQSVKAKIEYYKEHKQLPVDDDDGEKIADNPAELAKQINSLRARISQRKKKLIDVAGLDASTPGKQKQIDIIEADIRTLKHTLGLATQQMERYGKD